jgi:hypothetical protein
VEPGPSESSSTPVASVAATATAEVLAMGSFAVGPAGGEQLVQDAVPIGYDQDDDGVATGDHRNRSNSSDLNLDQLEREFGSDPGGATDSGDRNDDGDDGDDDDDNNNNNNNNTEDDEDWVLDADGMQDEPEEDLAEHEAYMAMLSEKSVQHWIYVECESEQRCAEAVVKLQAHVRRRLARLKNPWIAAAARRTSKQAEAAAAAAAAAAAEAEAAVGVGLQNGVETQT